MIARQRVEGLSADYIDLLARMLDKPVALSAFPDKAHLLRALARGDTPRQPRQSHPGGQ